MNAVAPTMLSSSKVPQPELACWWPSSALGGEQRGVLRQVLAVHQQVLPVHVHLHVVDPLRAQLVDHVQRHPHVAHQDLHRGLGVLVLEEQLHAVAGAHLGGLADPLDQPAPGVRVGGLERVVVALDPGPDDEVGAERAGEVGGLAGEPAGLVARGRRRATRARRGRTSDRGAGQRRSRRCRGRRGRRAPRRGCRARAPAGSGTRSRPSGRRGPPRRGAPSPRVDSFAVLGLVAARARSG